MAPNVPFLFLCYLATQCIALTEPTPYTKTNMKSISLLFTVLFLSACTNYQTDNSPTSGALTVYYDQGLAEHVINQAQTFEALYPNASVKLIGTNENEAVLALYNDSCESIVIARDLSQKEREAFASKKYTVSKSIVARTAVAFVVNSTSKLKIATDKQIIALLKTAQALRDSTNQPVLPDIVFDAPNSGILHYMLDSVVGIKTPAIPATTAGSGTAAVLYVSEHPNAMALIDFACISDKDSEFWKQTNTKIKLLAIAQQGDSVFEPPHQSSIKTGRYPFVRKVYVHRKAGEHSLAKGFESFVMGPKGQVIFLKQGLLPEKQQERSIRANTGGNSE